MSWQDTVIESFRKGVDIDFSKLPKPTYNNFGNRKVFVDLDGVTFDFDGGRKLWGGKPEEYKLQPGAYRHLKPYPEAIAGIRELLALGFDVWIATKIPSEAPWAATEKLYSIAEHLPELYKSVIITPNKGTLGTKCDFLIDDRPHKAHCEEFQGTFLRYGPTNEFHTWAQVMEFMRNRQPDANILYDYVVGDAIVPIRKGPLNPFVLVKDLPAELVERVVTKNIWLTSMAGSILEVSDRVLPASLFSVCEGVA